MRLDIVQQSAVVPNESGVLSKKGTGFHIPSRFAKENLFYVLWGNQYTCNQHYNVNRKYLDSFLLINIINGTLFLKYRKQHFKIPAGNVVFLDLHDAHQYKAEGNLLVTQQYMINGNATASYFELLFNQYGPITESNSKLSFLFHAIENELTQQFPNDHVLSLLLHQIFCAMTAAHQVDIKSPIQLAKEYIQQHFTEEITLNDIAAQASMSKYYFSRKFREETGSTPWNFLLRTRIQHAMNLLTETTFSVEHISELCGFSNTSHFIRAFKKETTSTPKQFQKDFLYSSSLNKNII